MYDPTYWYDIELSNDAWAQDNGYEDYDDYIQQQELEAKLEL